MEQQEQSRADTVAHIIGRKFQPSMEACDMLTRVKLMRFTGNQWNESWAWDREAVENAPGEVIDRLRVGAWRSATIIMLTTA